MNNRAQKRMTAEAMLFLALVLAAGLLSAAACWCLHQAKLNRSVVDTETVAMPSTEDNITMESEEESVEESIATPIVISPIPASPKPSSPSCVEILEYTAHDYVRDVNNSKTKRLQIYLPKDYDSSQEYDAVFLMHVLGQNESFWMGQLNFKESLDELIDSKLCRPLIAIMPDGYYHEDLRGVTGRSEYYEQFASEFRNDIFPFIKENYSISSFPEHIAFIGASFGAYMTVNSILRENVDLVGNYGYIGGGDIDPSLIQNRWDVNQFVSPLINWFYLGEGDRDDLSTVRSSYFKLLNSDGAFTEENLVFSVLYGYSHEPGEWVLGAKEALQTFFPMQEGDE